MARSAGDGGGSARAKSDADRVRFERFAQEQRAAVRRIVHERLGSALRRRLESEDVVQEALLQAAKAYFARRPGEYKDDEEILAMVALVIENKIRNLVRTHVRVARRSVKREESIEDHGGAGRFQARGKSPSSLAGEAELREELRRCVASLPPRQREILVLVHQRQIPVGKAAEEMGIQPDAAYVLLHRALRRLRGLVRDPREGGSQ